MNIRVFLVNSFAKTAHGGNPAGVVFNADDLQENDMKKIAKLIGYSETAFVSNSETADFRVRFFTPEDEVDICGHATIAVFHTMAEQGKISHGTYTQETKAGILQVEIKENHTIMMNQNLPQFSEVVSQKEIADSLKIGIDELIAELPIQVVSTGLRDIIVPVRNLEILNSMKPDFDEITRVSRKYNTIGYHLFTMETLGEACAHARNFAPLYDIPKDQRCKSWWKVQSVQ